MFKKILIGVLAFVLILSLTVGCESKKPGDKKTTGSDGKKNYISIATGGPSGTYYPLGGAMAKVYNDNIEGVTANAQATGASVENIELVSNGETEIAFVQNDITYYAYTATEVFEED